MIRFFCDTCSTEKPATAVWILGLAAEAVGVTAARREVSIMPRWERDRAVHPLAVHFCSEACKDKYITVLFGDTEASEDVMTVATRRAAKPRSASRGKSSSKKTRTRKRAA
jgi:hypothetical protein